MIHLAVILTNDFYSNSLFKCILFNGHPQDGEHKQITLLVNECRHEQSRHVLRVDEFEAI